MAEAAVGKRTKKFTLGLAKGASAIEETRALLLAWQPGEDEQTFLIRVRESGLLGRRTARRTRDLVFPVFRHRLLRPTDQPARCLKRIAAQNGNAPTFKELLFLYTARAEALLYDFVVERFWPAGHAGDLYLRLEDVQDFLREAVEDGRLPQPWTPSTQVKVSRTVLGSLRDFGLLHQDSRGRREIVLYRPTDFTVAYLAHELHRASLTDAALAEHPDWGLFGLTRERTLDRLDALGERAGLVVQRAGSVVRMTWLYATLDEVIDAYTR